MISKRTTLSLALAATLTPMTAALAQAEPRAAVAEAYAAFAHNIYRRCRERAEHLRASVDALVAAPSEQALAAARVSWIEARKVYGQTEVLRFYGGPIDNAKDGPETLLNAWPVDEAYIDLVADGDPAGGILQDAARYPNLSATVLKLANERGGGAKICVGWHAVEFMVWAQDFFDDGPGRRSYGAFVDGLDAHAARRREYLAVLVRLLVEQLRALEQAWRPAADNYRARFVAAPKVAVRRILTGMVVLSGFELGGERTAVAYETQDQEDEHSCFSDNTHIDFLADQEGVVAVWFGARRGGRGPGLEALAAARSPEHARLVSERVLTTLEAIEQLPAPFDQAVRLDAPDPGARESVLRALVALEQQAEALSGLALSMGFEIALTPGG